MRVPARVFASNKMLEQVLSDRSLEQLVNVTTLPGIKGHALAMPDVHEGYGFPIGGVAALSYDTGVISPGGIGYDINCGVRLLRSEKLIDEIRNDLEPLSKFMYNAIPSGLGKEGHITITPQEIDAVLTLGAEWTLRNGYATEIDLRHMEANGRLSNADPTQISDRAKQRGLDQLGTLGAGNHFAELDFVEEIYDEEIARTFGLRENQVVVLIHTGSRGLGHQVATDHIRIMMNVMGKKYGITLPDRELTCVPFLSTEGQNYFNAMAAAANFAWANRQMITWAMRGAWDRYFNGTGGPLELVYDLAHNIAKIEEHIIDNVPQKVILHRKGATRAFGPEHQELPPEYKNSGQPVLIPGSMGTASYVLAGTREGMRISFGSTCHGAGRIMSRHAAKKQVLGTELKQELMEAGVYIQAGSTKGLAEEAPLAYKDVDEVVETVEKAQIAKKVARLRPCIVIKG
ncbi:MAG: RtcB family protein [Candidatus Babeliaceae bacterium]|nr:RtcB family protein [Candidatus Babeliaceae bacterium]